LSLLPHHHVPPYVTFNSTLNLLHDYTASLYIFFHSIYLTEGEKKKSNRCKEKKNIKNVGLGVKMGRVKGENGESVKNRVKRRERGEWR
jgi:hypothetical protein